MIYSRTNNIKWQTGLSQPVCLWKAVPTASHRLQQVSWNQPPAEARESWNEGSRSGAENQNTWPSWPLVCFSLCIGTGVQRNISLLLGNNRSAAAIKCNKLCFSLVPRSSGKSRLYRTGHFKPRSRGAGFSVFSRKKSGLDCYVMSPNF